MTRPSAFAAAAARPAPAPRSPFVLALPGKGRIQTDALAFFERIGLEADRSGDRAYAGSIAGLDGVALRFMPARDIAVGLERGGVHIGVTGEDLIVELSACPEKTIAPVMRLGFSRADLAVAVPQCWIDVDDMADLEEIAAWFRSDAGRRMRIATKYPNLTRRFLGSCGVSDYRIVDSPGATEGAPASGLADAIVDISSSGATLAANGLKILSDGVIMRSQATLAVSAAARWERDDLLILRRILDLAGAEYRARATRLLRFRREPNDDPLIARLVERFQCIEPHPERESVTLHCPVERLHDALETLREAGKNTVTLMRVESIFERRNALYERVAAIADLNALKAPPTPDEPGRRG